MQLEPFGSLAVQVFAASLQLSEQSLSLSPMNAVHGLPVPPHTPTPLQVSVRVQKAPSSQVEPIGSLAVQESLASLQLSEQSLSPSPTFTVHGSPVPVQLPLPLQVDVVVQNSPSSHTAPNGSFAVQESVPSLQASLQSPSPSPTSPHGEPPPLQVPAPSH